MKYQNIKILSKDKRLMSHITHLRNSSNHKHIYAKQWLCHNIKKKKIITSFLWIAWLIIYKNLGSLHTKMHCPNFGWNWSSGSAEDIFLNFLNVFFISFSISLNYPIGKWSDFHLNKLESSSSKNGLCQVWLKLAQWL